MRLYFAATDPAVGREPFYLDLSGTTAIEPSAVSPAQRPYLNPLPDGLPLTAAIELAVGTKLQAHVFDLQGRRVQLIEDLGYLPGGDAYTTAPAEGYPLGLALPAPERRAGRAGERDAVVGVEEKSPP